MSEVVRGRSVPAIQPVVDRRCVRDAYTLGEFLASEPGVGNE